MAEKKQEEMQDIYEKLDDKNKDIMLLLAKGIEVAQKIST